MSDSDLMHRVSQSFTNKLTGGTIWRVLWNTQCRYLRKSDCIVIAMHTWRGWELKIVQRRRHKMCGNPSKIYGYSPGTWDTSWSINLPIRLKSSCSTCTGHSSIIPLPTRLLFVPCSFIASSTRSYKSHVDLNFSYAIGNSQLTRCLWGTYIADRTRRRDLHQVWVW